MKFKKLLSTVAALAIAASSFVGLGISANAADTAATLVHTGYATSGSSMGTAGVSVDTENGQELFNSLGTNAGYGQVAYAEFSLGEIDTSGITTLTFKFTMKGNDTRERDTKVYYMPSDFPTLGGASFVSDVTSKGTWLENISGTNGTAKEYTVTITDANILTTLLANPTKIVFGITDRGKGGIVYGKTSATPPTLTASSTPSYTVTYDVNGASSDEIVVQGNKPKAVPSVANYVKANERAEYTFKGWNKDSDKETVYTSAQVAEMAISAATTFTAVFEKGAVWAENILYQNKVQPIALNNDRETTYSIGAAVEDCYTIAADVTINYIGDNTSQFTELFTNESGATVAGLFATATTANNNSSNKPAIYFVTAGKTGSQSGDVSLETIGEANYKQLVAENDTNPGTMHLEFAVNEIDNTVTLTYNEKEYTLPLNNKATSINQLTYGGYRYNNGTISNIVITKTPVVTAVITKPGDLTTTVTAPKGNINAVDSTQAEYETLTADKDVTTVYVKVTNVADKEVKPVVVLNVGVGTETLIPTKATQGTDGYFIIQYVHAKEITPTINKVTYIGAADYVPTV